MTKSAVFWPNLIVFGPKINILWEEAKLLVPSYGEPIKYLFRPKNFDRLGSNFDLKILIFGTKSQLFVLESRFFIKRAYHQYTQDYPDHCLAL